MSVFGILMASLLLILILILSEGPDLFMGEVIDGIGIDGIGGRYGVVLCTVDRDFDFGCCCCLGYCSGFVVAFGCYFGFGFGGGSCGGS